MNHYTNFLLNLVFTSITFYGTQKGFLRLTMSDLLDELRPYEVNLIFEAPSGQQEAADIGEKPVARER
jgi:hypothetical protein